ncbi:MAG: sodium:solute symporter family protein [Candidatus Eiseniibacteriota bacterium]
MSPIAIGVCLYILVQLVVGLLASRRIRNQVDYLVAGRSLGYGLAVFSLFATWFGAESCIGAAGAVYGQGLSGGRADPFGYGICLLLMGLVFAGPLRRGGALTLGEAFRSRFSAGAERLVVVFLVPASLLWAAAQIRALGHVVSTVTGLDFAIASAVATGVVIVYTGTGGMRADVITDLVQGIALILGLAILLAVVVAHVGGPGDALALARSAVGAHPRADEGRWLAWEAWLVPIVGSITAQEMASRVLACRTPAIAQRSSLIGGGLYLAVGLMPVAIGLIGMALLPGLADPEAVIPALAQRHLSGPLQVVLLGALVSAILSTVDSNLLSASALLSRDVWPRASKASELTQLRLARLLVVVLGLAAFGLAMSHESVYGLVEEASAFGGGGMAVAMAFGLLTGFGGWRSAVAAMVTSMVVQVGGTWVWPITAPMTVSCLVSLVVYVVVAAWEGRRPSPSSHHE